MRRPSGTHAKGFVIPFAAHETKVESGTSQSKSGTSVNLSNSGLPEGGSVEADGVVDARERTLVLPHLNWGFGFRLRVFICLVGNVEFGI